VKRYYDRLMQTLMDWTGDLGEHPLEIGLPERQYLNTAFECRIDDPRAPLRHVIDPLETPPWGEQIDTEPNVEIRRVRCNDSFKIIGPCGPVTVRLIRE
jgi:hypothetical protein